MDPTRTFTSDLLSSTLAEAVTQLSFAAILERCIFVHASPPPQLPVTTPSLEVATQTFSHTAASRDVSTQLLFMESLASPSTLDALCPACAAQVPSLLLDAAVQAPLHSVATHDASTQLRSRSSSSGASSPTILQTAKLSLRHIAMLIASRRPNLLTLPRFQQRQPC